MDRALPDGEGAEDILRRDSRYPAATDGALPDGDRNEAVLRRGRRWLGALEGDRFGGRGRKNVGLRRRRLSAASGGTGFGGRRIGCAGRRGRSLPAMGAGSGKRLLRQICRAVMSRGLIGQNGIARRASGAPSSSVHMLIPLLCPADCLFPCHLNPFCRSSQGKPSKTDKRRP